MQKINTAIMCGIAVVCAILSLFYLPASVPVAALDPNPNKPPLLFPSFLPGHTTRYSDTKQYILENGGNKPIWPIYILWHSYIDDFKDILSTTLSAWRNIRDVVSFCDAMKICIFAPYVVVWTTAVYTYAAIAGALWSVPTSDVFETFLAIVIFILPCMLSTPVYVLSWIITKGCAIGVPQWMSILYIGAAFAVMWWYDLASAITSCPTCGQLTLKLPAKEKKEEGRVAKEPAKVQ